MLKKKKTNAMLLDLKPSWLLKLANYFLGLEKVFNIYPPYLGAGIRVKIKDPKTIVTKMKLTLFNKNYVGTHFGGSLYSMCDPFYMLILLQVLGKDYMVWDKKASIEFLKPGQGEMRAIFFISEEEISQIKKTVEVKRKIEWTFTTHVKNLENEDIAKVTKVLYIRKLRKKSQNK